MNANNDQYERTTIRYGDSQPHRAPRSVRTHCYC